MFGKHFISMYTGSMVGAGALPFAIMGYVIAAQRPHRELGSVVELNPVLLATILGEDVKDVEKGLRFLCEPDTNSRSKEHGGRRLVEAGPFLYQVVNGAKYRAIRDEESRLEQLRRAQRKHRQKKQLANGPSNGREAQYEKNFKEGKVDAYEQPIDQT